ncbi:methyltransferase domain-containing protein [Streptomyces albiaxialis]|uniref:Methyltransferase domain-containing protein n=1 Tax=Streptomyces albiaxialis TaxID=329523 RepID=A0ABP5ILM7_9ACTN
MPANSWAAACAPRHRLFSVLSCPLCGEPFRPADGALRCARGHSFDVARQGHVTLLPGGTRAPRADTAPMVRARAAFLDSGRYAPLTDALTERAAALPVPLSRDVVLDAGTGTGHHLARILDALPGAVGLGMDASPYALRRAARAHPRLGAVGWDVWRPLPVRTGSVGLLVNVFAPRNAPEFRRVLRPDGALLVVTPTGRHLAELRRDLGLLSVGAGKEERLRGALAGGFTEVGTSVREFALDLAEDDVVDLVTMGPNAHHADGLRARAGTLPRTPDGTYRTTASFRLSVFAPR